MGVFSRIERSGPKHNGRGRGFDPLISMHVVGVRSVVRRSNDQGPRPLRHISRPALPPREAWSRDCGILTPL